MHTVRNPTVDSFKRHAARYGPECVLETARDYLTERELAELALAVAGPGRRRRRTNGDLREQVLELHRRGLVRAAIADQLNVGDRRVGQILNGSEIPKNGGQKAFVQAELFVD